MAVADPRPPLGDPIRRAILERLVARPRAVGELAGELPVSRPAVSRHLRALTDAGLVVARPQGTRRIYRPSPDGVVRFWSAAPPG